MAPIVNKPLVYVCSVDYCHRRGDGHRSLSLFELVTKNIEYRFGEVGKNVRTERRFSHEMVYDPDDRGLPLCGDINGRGVP
jgi:hypothetical protein